MNQDALHKPVSALKLSQTFMVQNTILNNRAWVCSRYKHGKGETYKGGSRAGAEVGHAQFISDLRQEVGPQAFTAAVELKDSHISEIFSSER